MINFLKETEEVLDRIGKTWNDVKFIGSEDYFITVEQFKKIADVRYDSGYGAQHMPTDILIVFNDGLTMNREEYDGEEGWNYIIPFDYPTKQFPSFIPLPNNKMWDTLRSFSEGEFCEKGGVMKND